MATGGAVRSKTNCVYIFGNTLEKKINNNKKNLIQIYPELVIRCRTSSDIRVQVLILHHHHLHQSVALSLHRTINIQSRLKV